MSKEKTEAPSVKPVEENTVIHFSDIWKGIVKFWWVAVILGILVSLLMSVTSYSKFRPVYEANATFTVNTETMSLTGEGLPSYAYIYDNATASNLADTFPYILSSDILTEAIRDDLNISYLPASLSASAVSSTNMFILTARGSDPQKTYDVLVSAMKNYPNAAKYIVGNVRLTVIIEPQIPVEPINKFTYKVAFKGFGIGVLLGAAWIFVYALFRKTVKTKKDISGKLKLETIGTIPEVSFKKYKKEKADCSILIKNERIGKGFLESVRVMRNTFLHLVKDDEKVVMVTSTAPGEGKTSVAVNLALSLSDYGKKVLVVDADLRNPSVLTALGTHKDETEWENKQDLYHIVQPEDFGVYCLLFTDKEHTYWKIMNVDFLNSLFEKLKSDYDFIIVDTPPCGLVSDTSLIVETVDAVVYVVLQDTVRVNRILGGIDSVGQSEARVIGAVMNGAQSGLAGYGENYGYSYGYGHYKSYTRYGYGYGYGYGYREKKKKDKSKPD